jgi:hypothetical protein
MWLWLVASIAVRTVTVAGDAGLRPVRIACPVNATTRIVFPEPMRQLKRPAERSSLALSFEQTKPLGVILVRPVEHPSSETVEFLGPAIALRVRLESAAEGDAAEVRLSLDREAAPARAGDGDATETASPAPIFKPADPTPPAVASPSAPPADVPPFATSPSPVPSPSAADLQVDGILNARAVLIGRREGLPGQPGMVLVDALQGEKWLWLRFVLEGGASSRVGRVVSERGEVTTCTQAPQGNDLRIVVQLPTSEVTKRSQISLEIESGAVYTFGLGRLLPVSKGSSR